MTPGVRTANLMGLIDFFSRRARAEQNDRKDAPRCDHYSFSHIVLRDHAFQNPVSVVTELASASSHTSISDLWDAVEDICREHGEPVTLDPDDILIHKLAVETWPCALVEMPAAARKTEAFFVALVLTIDLNNPEAAVPPCPLRYLTLEFSETNSIDEVQTILGEWNQDGTHTSLGPGPEPNAESFILCIRKHLTSRKLT